MINHFYILDLENDRSFVRFLNESGYDVYLLNWGYPEDADRHMNFSHLLENRLIYFLDRVQQFSRSEKMHLVGHCLGGTIATMLAAYDGRYFQSLTLLTTPIDFSAESKFKSWIQKGHVDFDLLQEAYGNVPWPLLHASFLSLKPLGQYRRLKKYFSTRMTPAQKKSFWAFEMWTHDSISFRGSSYLTLIKDLYRDNLLILNQFRVGKKILKLSNIQVPVLVVNSNEDTIVPPQSAALKKENLPNSPSVENFLFSGGHVGCLVNKKTQITLWPKIASWLESKNNEFRKF